MKFAYPENEHLIKRLVLENIDLKKALGATISNLKSLACTSEREGLEKPAAKQGKKLLAMAIRFHERANELQAYLDERNRN